MKLTKELFEGVIAYSIGEIGAMGPNGMLTCFKSNGESFTLNFLSDETPWEEIKKNFPEINGCKFNGPTRAERVFTNLIIIGESGNEVETRVNPGWRHWWLDFGNHLVIREEYFDAMKEQFQGMDNCDITFYWTNRLEKVGFVDHLNEIKAQYDYAGGKNGERKNL